MPPSGNVQSIIRRIHEEWRTLSSRDYVIDDKQRARLTKFLAVRTRSNDEYKRAARIIVKVREELGQACLLLLLLATSVYGLAALRRCNKDYVLPLRTHFQAHFQPAEVERTLANLRSQGFKYLFPDGPTAPSLHVEQALQNAPGGQVRPLQYEDNSHYDSQGGVCLGTSFEPIYQTSQNAWVVPPGPPNHQYTHSTMIIGAEMAERQAEGSTLPGPTYHADPQSSVAPPQQQAEGRTYSYEIQHEDLALLDQFIDSEPLKIHFSYGDKYLAFISLPKHLSALMLERRSFPR